MQPMFWNKGMLSEPDCRSWFSAHQEPPVHYAVGSPGKLETTI